MSTRHDIASHRVDGRIARVAADVARKQYLERLSGLDHKTVGSALALIEFEPVSVRRVRVARVLGALGWPRERIQTVIPPGIKPRMSDLTKPRGKALLDALERHEQAALLVAPITWPFHADQ